MPLHLSSLIKADGMVHGGMYAYVIQNVSPRGISDVIGVVVFTGMAKVLHSATTNTRTCTS